MTRSRALLGPLAVALALVPQPAVADEPNPNCGNLAPFVVECLAGTVVIDGSNEVRVGVVGFAGEVEVRLIQPSRVTSFTCAALAAPQLTTCAPPSGQQLIEGQTATVRCFAWPYPATSGAEAGPAGPWGCEVTR